MSKDWLKIQAWYYHNGYRHASAAMEEIIAAHRGDATVLLKKLNIR